jgi:hypothetical protein
VGVGRKKDKKSRSGNFGFFERLRFDARKPKAYDFFSERTFPPATLTAGFMVRTTTREAWHLATARFQM